MSFVEQSRDREKIVIDYTSESNEGQVTKCKKYIKSLRKPLNWPLQRQSGWQHASSSAGYKRSIAHERENFTQI